LGCVGGGGGFVGGGGGGGGGGGTLETDGGTVHNGGGSVCYEFRELGSLKKGGKTYGGKGAPQVQKGNVKTDHKKLYEKSGARRVTG